MPRSAVDATRFTATGPYAYSKTGSATTIPVSTPPPNETPSQKVARLRAAAQKARLASESGTLWDRVVSRGRVVADVAHRVTTMGLIGLSGLAVVVTVVALGDMARYNRRKRKEWLRVQQENYSKALGLAIEAEAAGTLTDDLRIILENERAIAEAQSAREQKTSIWQKTKGALFDGPKEEQRGGKLATMGEEAQLRVSRIMAQTEDTLAEGPAAIQLKEASTAITTIPAKGSSGRTGGPLDRLGDKAAIALSSKSRGLIDWMTGR